jgi:hypothetical protein
MKHNRQQWINFLLASGILLLAGCGTSSYKMVKTEAVQPAAPMGLTAADAGLEFSVTGLVVYGSPGAWKRQAYWDEYVVRLANHGVEPVKVEVIELADVLDRWVPFGTDPWALEKAGRQQEKYLKSLHAPADAGASANQRVQQHGSMVEGAKGVASLAGLSLLYVPTLAPVLGPAIVYGAPLVLMAYAPVFLANKLVIDPKNRDLVLTTFNRRRLVLPAELAPGASVTGSVFFPLTPGPERIAARGISGEGPIRVTVELPGLAGLHFTAVPNKSALKAAKSWPGPDINGEHPSPESNAATSAKS